ncbi:hypothetical protein [Paenibacillus sp. YYML68]|uniref:hypothetical protein n=1 Tax=Paenibacillus sp. YYML68 TaxID=2909250 RepID=UPI00249318A1|nr:hypothetical protein [Paenibacillus sp. YYML68]
MKRNGFAWMLVCVFALMCVGLVSAKGVERSLQSTVTLESITSRSVDELMSNPSEVAKSIVVDYYNEIIKQGDTYGVPLNSFEIHSINSQSLDEIKVTVTLTFSEWKWPPIETSVIKVGDRYQVRKDICAYDYATSGRVSCSQDARMVDGNVSFSY